MRVCNLKLVEADKSIFLRGNYKLWISMYKENSEIIHKKGHLYFCCFCVGIILKCWVNCGRHLMKLCHWDVDVCEAVGCRASGESEQFSVLSQSELSECRRVVSQTQKYFLTPHHTTPHQAKHLNTKLGQLVNKEFTLFPR